VLVKELQALALDIRILNQNNEEIDLDACLDDDEEAPSQDLIDTMEGDDSYIHTAETDDMLIDSVDDDDEDDEDDFDYEEEYYEEDDSDSEPNPAGDILSADDF
jgi:DNA-directed RNA polymerase subunit beta